MSARAGAQDDVIAPTGTHVRSAAEIDYPPLCFVTDEGRAAGFAVELLQAAAAAMGREVTFSTGPWPEVRGLLERGEIDALPLVGRTPEREDIFDFTFPYLSLHGAIVVRKGTTDIHRIEDLKGRDVAVLEADNAEEYLRRNNPGSRIHTRASFETALRELSAGSHDAVIIQRLLALRIMSETGLTNLKVVAEPLADFRQDFCFAVAEGDRDTLALLNEGLALVMADGTVEQLQARWLGALRASAPPIAVILKYSAMVAGPLLVLALVGLVWLMRRRIRSRTAELSRASGLLEQVSYAQSSYIITGSLQDTFDRLLEAFVSMTNSEFGFLDEVLEESDGTRYKLSLSISNIAWDEDSAKLYEMLRARDLEFRNLNNLSGLPALTGELLISNDVGNDPRAGGIPPGHPSMKTFMGVPLYFGDKLVGVAGVANSHDGYDETMAQFLEPFMSACAGIIHASRQQVKENEIVSALRESKERFDLAMNATRDGLYDWNLLTDEVYFSPGWKRMLGYGLDELPSEVSTWEKLVDPEGLERSREMLQKLISQERDRFEIEFKMKHKKGHWIDILSRAEAAFDREGNAVRIVGTHVDISELRRAGEVVAKSEANLRQMTNAMQETLSVVDLDGTFLYANVHAARNMSGSSNADIVGKNIRELLPVDQAEEMIRQCRAVHDTGETLQREVTVSLAKGDAWFLNTLTPIEFGSPGVSAVLSVSLEITERKRAEAALEKRMIALTQPLDNAAGVAFEELFNLEDIQRLQDQFADATGVASIITGMEGVPITRPSNFRRLCRDIIRKSDKGLANCFRSDIELGKANPEGPTIQPCLSGGLWDAGAAITVGGRHIANWLIGQVRNETQTEEKMRAYAREIEADEEAFIEAFREVPTMSTAQFSQVAQALYTLANQLSSTAYQNVQQSRFISEKLQAEEDLRQSEERFRALHNASFGGIVIHDKGVILECNRGLSEITGYDYSELIGMDGFDLLSEDTRDEVIQRVRAGHEKPYEAKGVRKNGEIYPLRLEARNMPYKGKEVRVVEFRDITDSKRIEKEKEELESQLRQAQKMEAVGRLAGGVAHDFNNMLGVIIGHAELILDEGGLGQPIDDYLKEIKKAGERSADLTRQLLAFARKQAVSPKVLDLNRTVAGMTRMLRRLIGEDIDLAWMPAKELWPVIIDPSQVDQVLANLCVNSRDAIDDVGKITIETANVVLDEEYCADHIGFTPGEFVMLAVSDNGCGMDQETLSNVFEPFFTTKKAGEGTGLGLATVYGIVKQNNGFVNAYSEPHQGTTFKLYLPRHLEKRAQVSDKLHAQPVKHGHETILLVEDESAILRMTTLMLERLGYTVIAAGSPGEAIELARECGSEINLLITDVVMPEMNGRDLARNILKLYPNLKRLFMSGYTANVIAHHGVLDDGINFIQKPFSREEFGSKVREVMDKDS